MSSTPPCKLDLYMAHRTALVDYAAPIVGCRAQAEDVVQEAWLRFNSRSDDQGEISQPVGYLYRIVRNLAFDLTRRTVSERRLPGGESLLDELSDDSPGPEQHATGSNELAIVNAALAELPERVRRAFEMHRLEGHTLQHIASTLSISVGLAHQLVHQALCHCADKLELANG